MVSAVYQKRITLFPPQSRQGGYNQTSNKRQRARWLILVLGLAILAGLAVKGAESPAQDQGFSEPLGWHSFKDVTSC